MAELLAGRLPAAAYTLLLGQLARLYAALEQTLADVAELPGLGGRDGLVLRELSRTEALEADLGAWQAALLDGGAPPRAEADPPRIDAFDHYLERLRGPVLAEQPWRLAAHVYVRWLGDLHGGQMLAARVAALDGAPSPPAVAFYDFGPMPRVLALRQQLRSSLAALPLEAAQCDAVTDEALWAFEQHVRWFDELSATVVTPAAR